MLSTRYWFSRSRIQQLCVGDTRFPARRPRGVPMYGKWKPPDPHPFQPPPGNHPRLMRPIHSRITCGPIYVLTYSAHPPTFLAALLRSAYTFFLHHFQKILTIFSTFRVVWPNNTLVWALIEKRRGYLNVTCD